MTASIDLWSAEDTAALIPYVVAGLAIIAAAVFADRKNTRVLDLRRDLQSAQNHNRTLDKENRRLRWENAQLRGVQPSAALHLGVPRRRLRRSFRPAPALPPAWTQPEDPEPPSWPPTRETAVVALHLDPAPTEEVPVFHLTGEADGA